jgi:mono/diheme cytochrome c family protein
MMPPFMRRPARVLIMTVVTIATAAFASACGTQKISVSKSNDTLYHGAVLFNQRCAGCHTLSYAATHGSAANVRSSQFNNGPNFNVRCERPQTRVLYAIENGGFSGAIMPQNIVLGQDALDVAQFVATYAGRQAPKVPGTVQCQSESIGTIPAPGAPATTSTSSSTTTIPGTTSSSSSSSTSTSTKSSSKSTTKK